MFSASSPTSGQNLRCTRTSNASGEAGERRCLVCWGNHRPTMTQKNADKQIAGSQLRSAGFGSSLAGCEVLLQMLQDFVDFLGDLLFLALGGLVIAQNIQWKYVPALCVPSCVAGYPIRQLLSFCNIVTLYDSMFVPKRCGMMIQQPRPTIKVFHSKIALWGSAMRLQRVLKVSSSSDPEPYTEPFGIDLYNDILCGRAQIHSYINHFRRSDAKAYKTSPISIKNHSSPHRWFAITTSEVFSDGKR